MHGVPRRGNGLKPLLVATAIAAALPVHASEPAAAP